MSKYFPDAHNFSYQTDVETPCSICKTVGICFDAGGYYGSNEIECICENCLAKGALIELDIETNEISHEELSKFLTEEEANELGNEIVYKTPALPTWQDRDWPIVNQEVCTFIKIADKHDFSTKVEFKNSFIEHYQTGTDFDWLWEMLPNEKITNYKNGNYDVSIYLFKNSKGIHCTWDAN